MAGAFTLAEKLISSDFSGVLAFQRYESAHRRLVEPKQRNVGRAAALIVPKTRLGIVVRNTAARLWPGRL